MNLMLLVSLVCVASGSLVGLLEASRLDSLHWNAYKSKYDKVYADAGEDSMRMRSFLDNKRMIEQHNAVAASQSGYLMSLNQFSDRTGQELSGLLKNPNMDATKMSDKVQRSGSEEWPEFLRKMLEVDVKDLPKEVDWRKVAGRVTPVKDQGYCRASWAFATVGLLEGQQYRFNLSQVVPLSEQNLIDCSESNFGCEGGFVDEALDDMASNGGIESDTDYPYVVSNKRHSDQKCTFNKAKSVMTLKGSHLLDGTEESLQKVVAQYGPVAVAIDATINMIFYEWGVFYDPACSSNAVDMNEAVLVVGYGVDDMQGDYWILKKFWGTKLGIEGGYVKLARNKHNHCGIANFATVAVF